LWGSEVNTKAALLQGDSADLAARLKRNLLGLVAGDCLFSGTAEYDLEEPSGKKCASAAKKMCHLGYATKSV